MADQTFPPGSRAVKIPISKLKTRNPRRRSNQDNSMQRTDSTEGSSSETGFSASVASQSKETSLKAHKTMASPATNNVQQLPLDADLQSQLKDKQRASELSPPNSVPARALQQSFAYSPPLSPSMLLSSSYKSINLNSHMGDADVPPRLICYTKHSQGFTWNDELFLPSYLVGRRYRGSKNRRRWGYNEDEDEEMGEDDVPFDEESDRCPVTDIFVTDEEAAKMLP